MSSRPDQAVDCPLVVDLDGTLTKTDLFYEALLGLLRRHPWQWLLLPLWLLRGRAFLKCRLAERVALDPALLPYPTDFLDWLRREQGRGRRLLLATAAPRAYAEAVAAHLGLFDTVLASDPGHNLAGTHKSRRLLAEFGPGGFDYAGNARPDLAVWPHARRAVLVNPDPGIAAAAARLAKVERVFEDRPARPSLYRQALRPHQWLKNVLVFVPLLAAHQLDREGLLVSSLTAFLAFGLCASSAYLLNDLLDLPADRRHPRKRRRPFAAGDLPLRHGLLLSPLLLAAGLGLGLLSSLPFLGVLTVYYALTLAYSLYLKRVVLLDVLVLAGLYTARIIAGAAAIGIWPSSWLLAFSLFLFFSLAMVKRYTELVVLRRDGERRTRRRGYRVDDLQLLPALGGAAGYLAVLVLALYINSDTVVALYTRPWLIWLLCPLLLYWISRMWLIAHRGDMHDDPIVFALEDRASLIVAALGAAVVVAAL